MPVVALARSASVMTSSSCSVTTITSCNISTVTNSCTCSTNNTGGIIDTTDTMSNSISYTTDNSFSGVTVSISIDTTDNSFSGVTVNYSSISAITINSSDTGVYIIIDTNSNKNTVFSVMTNKIKRKNAITAVLQ